MEAYPREGGVEADVGGDGIALRLSRIKSVEGRCAGLFDGK